MKKYQTYIGVISFLLTVGYGWKIGLIFLLIGTLPAFWVAHKLQLFKDANAINNRP